MADEHLSRLRQMVDDQGQTWDLSPNDKAAIKHALGMIASLADVNSGFTGRSVDEEIRIAGEVVQRNSRS